MGDMSRGAGAGPPDDLAAFYDDQWDRVRGSLVLFTGSRELGEELAQEAFVRVCQRWDQVRTMEAPGAWVHRVGINLAISHGRRRGSERRARRRLEAVRAEVAAPPEPEAGVRGALLALDIDERAVVVLRFWADLSVKQVAEVLGIPEGTVKTRTRAGLAALRASGLAATDPEDDPIEEEVR